MEPQSIIGGVLAGVALMRLFLFWKELGICSPFRKDNQEIYRQHILAKKAQKINLVSGRPSE